MKRKDAVDDIIRYLLKHGVSEDGARAAMDYETPMYGCLLMLEALKLIEFDD